MSWDMQKVEYPFARKDYHCDAAEWINNSDLGDDEFTVEDLALIEKARSEGFKVLKGHKYIKVSGKWEGNFEVFRARPELNQICVEYEIYDE